MSQNIPNPFNPETLFNYSIKGMDGDTVKATLIIYNVLGQQVRKLFDDDHLTGDFTQTWFGKNDHNNSVGSGIYFARLTTPDKIVTRKMLLLK